MSSQFRSLLRTLALTAACCTGLCAQEAAPLHYACHHTATPPRMDGKLDDAAWKSADWTSDFGDILGPVAAKPQYRTRVKMLWDEKFLYIAAHLDEPNVHGTLTAHDSVIFHDDDFEFFLKPLPDTESYYEFEINALNTTWDLFLNKPYRLGGKADNSWEATGVQTAVHVDGTLNNAAGTDRGWTVEIALPLTAFESRQHVPAPAAGSTWRINFSRVEWLPGHPREENWVWSPQGVVNMHVPEKWGFLDFAR